MPDRITLSVIGVLGLVTACGYGFADRPAHIPADAKTISIRPVQNQSTQVGVELALASALEDVIRERGQLRVVPGEEGDLVLTANVRRFTFSPVGFSRIDRARQYETTMVLDVAVQQHGNGRVLWSSNGLVETFDAPVTPGVIIPSSPRFQQGTLNARDLSGLTTIQRAEDRRSQEVLRQLVEAMARSIYSHMMEGF